MSRKGWSPYDMPYIVDKMVQVSAASAASWLRWAEEGLTYDFDAVASQQRTHENFSEAAEGKMIWVDADLCQMVEETSPSVPQWSPSAILPSPSGVMLWEKPPAPIIWVDENEEFLTTGDGIAWSITGDQLSIHFLTRLPKHRGRLSPLRKDSPVVPAAAIHIPVDAPQGAGAGIPVYSVTSDQAAEAGIAALAAVGATWLLMTQDSVVEDVETTIERKPRKDRPTTITRPVVTISERRLHRRRHQSSAGDEGGRGVRTERQYSGRWWVRGHWRQQPYGPKRQLRKPVFIEPHTAGPADLPLDGRPKVERWRK